MKDNRPPIRRLASTLAAGLMVGTASAASAATVELMVENVKSTEGALMVAVYGSADDFRKKAVREVKVESISPATKIGLTDLPPGDYAIALFQDRNGNAKVDSNLFGIPTEPYGFSNNPKNLMAPPTWDQTRFSVGTETVRVPVRLTD